MQAAQNIRRAVDRVSRLRQLQQETPGRAEAVAAVKAFQARRFAATYADLLADTRYRVATRFFLDELYGDKDFTERDAQFARIAGAVQRLLPEAVAGTAVALAELHAMTETLDDAMAQHWVHGLAPASSASAAYIAAWRAVGDRALRLQQLEGVLGIGKELDRLTRARGLRLMLKMMRGPANAAGLGALQGFLEAGFDTFASMRGAREFLDLIARREKELMDDLFDSGFVACETRLRSLMQTSEPA